MCPRSGTRWDGPGGRRGRAGGVKPGIAGPQARETVGFPDGAALFGMFGAHEFEETFHPCIDAGFSGIPPR
ncbi:hypothetical protein GCM10017778_64890 [Streptomyces vinaceus]|nr:hypothetical protein GCM10017778_64890 [Streptomyces vinaceus]